MKPTIWHYMCLNPWTLHLPWCCLLKPLCFQQWHSSLLNAGAPWWIWYVIGGDTRCSTPTPSPQNVCVCVWCLCVWILKVMNSLCHIFMLNAVKWSLWLTVWRRTAQPWESDAFYLLRDFIKFPFCLWWAQTLSPTSSVSCFLTDYVLHNILPPVWLQCFLFAGLRTFIYSPPRFVLHLLHILGSLIIIMYVQ